MMRVFLSYHSPDRQLAVDLKRAIQTARPNIDVYLDQSNLRHGFFWQPALFDAIANADPFLILLGNRLGIGRRSNTTRLLTRRQRMRLLFSCPSLFVEGNRAKPARLGASPLG